MSESYNYGGDGIRERTEYNKPSAENLKLYVEMVEEEIEALFACAEPSPKVKTSYARDSHDSYHGLGFSYSIPHADQTSVNIEHRQHAEGTLCEEYLVNVKTKPTKTSTDFMNCYSFKRYAGENWQAWVEHNKITTMPEDEDDSKYYSRHMTPYDFDEFFKDVAQINSQLRMLLIQ